MAPVAEIAPAKGEAQAPRRMRSAPAYPAPRRTSAAAMVRSALRAEIINMTRRPGDPVSEKAIAAAFGISRTPVREALLALSEEGLIDIFPQSGTFVARIPLAGLPEAILIRMSLEDTIVKLAAEAAGAEDIALLLRDLDEQRDAGERGDLIAFHQLDEAFHGHIAAIAGYPGVWTLVQQVKFQMDRFRHLTLPMANRPLSIVDEHAVIVQAIAGHDPSRASAAMTAHLATMRSGLELARAANPDFFIDDSALPARERT